MELSNHTDRSFLLDLPFGCKVHCKTILPLLHFSGLYFWRIFTFSVPNWSGKKEQETILGARNSSIDFRHSGHIFCFHHSRRAGRSPNCKFEWLFWCIMYHFSFTKWLKYLNEYFQVRHIKQGINPSSVHKIYFSGPFLAKGFKIGVVAGLIALTVRFDCI